MVILSEVEGIRSFLHHHFRISPFLPIGYFRAMHVYIITNAHGTLYIEVCADLASRMLFHAHTTHNSFAHRYNCDRLIYVESYDNPEDAIRREKQLKGWRRAKKVGLIYKVNPHWKTIPLG